MLPPTRDLTRPLVSREFILRVFQLILAGFLFLITWFGFELYRYFNATRPSLLVGLNLNRGENHVSEEFSRRVDARFPVGSSEIALRAELEEQGFETPSPLLDRRPFVSTHEHQLTYSLPSTACGHTFYVIWSADEGSVQGARGFYRSVCM